MSILQNMEDFLVRHKGLVAATPMAGFLAPWVLATLDKGAVIDKVLMSQFGLDTSGAAAAMILVPAGLAAGSLIATNAVFGANAVRKWYNGEHEPSFAKEPDIDRSVTGQLPSIDCDRYAAQRPHLVGQVRETMSWAPDRDADR